MAWNTFVVLSVLNESNGFICSYAIWRMYSNCFFAVNVLEKSDIHLHNTPTCQRSRRPSFVPVAFILSCDIVFKPQKVEETPCASEGAKPLEPYTSAPCIFPFVSSPCIFSLWSVTTIALRDTWAPLFKKLECETKLLILSAFTRRSAARDLIVNQGSGWARQDRRWARNSWNIAFENVALEDHAFASF